MITILIEMSLRLHQSVGGLRCGSSNFGNTCELPNRLGQQVELIFFLLSVHDTVGLCGCKTAMCNRKGSATSTSHGVA